MMRILYEKSSEFIVKKKKKVIMRAFSIEYTLANMSKIIFNMC